MLTNEMLTKYYELVENNCHGELLEEIARDFKLKGFEEIFKSINTIHNLEGYLNNDVKELRDRIEDELFTRLAYMLSDAEYEALRSVI